MTSPSELLSIGELAQATGVNTTTLRAWESRYGFPRATRLPSGHRRYHPDDVAAVRAVARRRDSGLRLDVAIAEILAAARPSAGSVFATLRREHARLRPERLHKATLTALSWAVEDEFCARADRARIFGAFQTGLRFRPSRARWTEFARIAASATVFADFTDEPDEPDEPDEAGAAPPDARLSRIQLGPDALLRREWVVVCDSADLPVALAAWEIPGQDDTADSARVFEAIWTVEPAAVRTAARACARIAQEADPEIGGPLLLALADAPAATAPDPVALQSLFTRVLTYVDRR